MRVYKNVGGDKTSYIYFGGQPIAEAHEHRGGSGVIDWSDYIYAGSRRIAKHDAFEDDLMVTGNYTGQNGALTAWCNLPTGSSSQPYLVRAGDQINWRQAESPGTRGGIYADIGDGSNTTWTTYDTDGQLTNSDTRDGWLWVSRTFNLASYVGRSITSLHFGADQNTAAGSWGIVVNDVVIRNNDGTVIPLYTSQPGVAPGCYNTSNTTIDSTARHLDGLQAQTCHSSLTIKSSLIFNPSTQGMG